MSSKNNLTDNEMDTETTVKEAKSGSEQVGTKSGHRLVSNASFLEPQTPAFKPTNVKNVANGKKSGRPVGSSNKRKSTSYYSETETDDENDNARRIRELERANEELVKRVSKLEEAIGLVLKDKSKLASQVSKLEEENEELNKWKEVVKKNSNPQPQITYSGILKSKESELLIKKIARTETKEAENIEKNIVISGIVKMGDSEENVKLNDTKKVDEVLEVLDLRRDQVESQRRIRTINSNSNIIIVKFKEVQYTSKAVRNALNLRSKESFKGVYVNRDKTRSERYDEKAARDEAKVKKHTTRERR
jgi:hypothetical protein